MKMIDQVVFEKHDVSRARLLGTILGTATGTALAIWLTLIICVG